MFCCFFFFFQAEDGIRDLVRSRGLGDVYKRQSQTLVVWFTSVSAPVGQTETHCPQNVQLVSTIGRPKAGEMMVLKLSLIHI